MTIANFKYIDTNSYRGKPWSKVDGPGTSFKLVDHARTVYNIRGQEDGFSTDNAGFTVYNEPAKEKVFTDERAIRENYYAEVESMLKRRLPGVKKVVMFDHTIRRRVKDAPRQPVQQVHVDQTPGAAEVRVRRHLPAEIVERKAPGSECVLVHRRLRS
jgi:hypothetical protein